MSVDTFISQFAGGARANRFRVTITWPGAVGSPNVADEIVVHAAQLPSSTLGVVQVPYMGRMFPLPGDRTFEDWTVTVLNDISFSHRNKFESWSNLILSHQGNVQTIPNYAGMVANITVQQLDRKDNVIKTFTLRNAWPVHVSAIDVGYQNNDQVEEFTVSFAYTDWASADTTT